MPLLRRANELSLWFVAALGDCQPWLEFLLTALALMSPMYCPAQYRAKV
ncbi:MAG: hypothetical protein ACPGVO_16045 [Spirulinaceae cyanobacterium]